MNQPDWDPEASVLKAERPWEMGGVSQDGTVLYDEEQRLFRFSYLTLAGSGGYEAKMVTMSGKQWLENGTMLAYATSEDGAHWDRPNLGQVDFEGSSGNNLIAIGSINAEGCGIVFELDDPDPRHAATTLSSGSTVRAM